MNQIKTAFAALFIVIGTAFLIRFLGGLSLKPNLSTSSMQLIFVFAALPLGFFTLFFVKRERDQNKTPQKIATSKNSFRITSPKWLFILVLILASLWIGLHFLGEFSTKEELLLMGAVPLGMLAHPFALVIFALFFSKGSSASDSSFADGIKLFSWGIASFALMLGLLLIMH